MLRFVFFVAMWAGTVWQALAWQSKVLIRGYVEEADSRERLVGAHVFEVRSSRGTVTDNFGYFSLQVPVEADSVLQLRVSYTGYQSVWKELPEGRDTFLLIRMQAGEQLSEVVVKAAEGGQATTIDRQVMSVGQIARMPAMFGEADVFKALSLLPGVQPGQEGQSAIFVRGGSRDQNLVLLDGVPLYFTNHFAGFFSVFNPDALKQVQLYKGGFPAHYGGRLSSVLDLTMKEGHMSEWHAKGAMGLLSSRLMAEGPIVKDRASMLVAARRSWTDLIVLPLIYELGGYEKWERASFWFGDLNFKVNWMINDRNRLFASGYLGRDQYNFNLREAVGNGDFLTTGSKTRWDNSTFSLRWQSLLSDALTVNWVAHHSNYLVALANRFNTHNADKQITSSFNSNLSTQVKEQGLTATFLYAGLVDHELRFGASSVRRRLQPFMGQVVQNETALLVRSGILRQAEHALFLSDMWQKNDWRVQAGVRLAGVTGPLLVSWAPELRLKVSRHLRGQRALWVAFDQMRQYLHLAQSETIALPTERWLPATRRFPPERAWQMSAGAALPAVAGGRLDIGAYYKRMYNLVTWADGISFARPNEDWEQDLVLGSGQAYGLECQWTRSAPRWDLTLAGTLSRSWRRFAAKNHGRRFPHLFDRPVALNAEVLWRFSDRFQIAAFWTLSSGMPQTLLKRKFSTPVDWNLFRARIFDQLRYAYEYSALNAIRLPPHHRLDLSLRWYKKKKSYERWWIVGVYNALLRANVMYLNYDESSGKYVGVGSFPVMPFAAFEFSF